MAAATLRCCAVVMHTAAWNTYVVCNHRMLPSTCWSQTFTTLACLLPESSPCLPLQGYWLGLRRDDQSQPWALATGAPVGTLPMTSPYVHWSWTFASDSAAATSNCGLAVATLAYDYYLGNSSAAGRASRASYSTTGADAAYGWTAGVCSIQLQAMCEVLAGVYACTPPPTPPTPPPLPPGPPAALVRNRCELLTQLPGRGGRGVITTPSPLESPMHTSCPCLMQ